MSCERRKPGFGALAVVLLLAGWHPTAPGADPTSGGRREVPDNPIDEDGDGWLASSLGYRVRATHPRVLLTKERLKAVIDRMCGPNARDPYRRWFDLIKRRADEGAKIELVSLALIYKATGSSSYKKRLLSRIPEQGPPDLSELYAVDILFDELDSATKRKIMRRAGAGRDVFYYCSTQQSQTGSARWGYHSAHGACVALAYAGVFVMTDVACSEEVRGDPQVYTFNEAKFIHAASKELSPEGCFLKTENRIAGDPAYNSALPGSAGGMYDNIGYDHGEEAASARLLAEFHCLTGEARHGAFLHDRHRGVFYQHMSLPHKYRRVRSDMYSYKAGAEPHQMAQVWNTQSSMWVTQPNVQIVALLHSLYRDPKIQHYVNRGIQFERRGHNYDGIYWDLVCRDDTAPASGPSENPTAMYFSGPGLVSMREDWSNDAAFALFMAGEGISRRYEDSCSFIFHRKTHIIPHAGARIRGCADNMKHFWYHQRSASKNTIVVYDPNECFDVGKDGKIAPLHSRPRLVDSDNLGGQLFEVTTSKENGRYPTGSGAEYATGMSTRRYGTVPERLFERANVTKFEHVEGDYTYCVGDGTNSYTRKVELFERELLYLRPDVFVIFDRVKVASPNLKTVWRIHTVNRPVPQAAAVASALGMEAYQDATYSVINHPKTTTHIDSLLPRRNRVVVRGGDSILCDAQPLRAGRNITARQVRELDIPRWVEIFAVGRDVEGSLTVQGDAEEGRGVTEVIGLSGSTMDELRSVPTSLTATALTDARRHWRPNRWKNHMVELATRPTARVRITGNNENTLFGAFPQGAAWQYTIYRPLANSYKHWRRIERITTSDLDVDHLTISVPHYFDTIDAKGRLHSFSPHTDHKHDIYRRSDDLGRYTLDVEASERHSLHNFLSVICARDPGAARPTTRLLQGEGFSGVLSDGRFAVFANDRQPLTTVDVTLPARGKLSGVIADLVPGSTLYHRLDGNRLRLSAKANGGRRAGASAMGVLKLTLTIGP
ncbi:MAG: hypothetical protein WBF17_21005 [Phycisphaerae bacterium]